MYHLSTNKSSYEGYYYFTWIYLFNFVLCWYFCYIGVFNAAIDYMRPSLIVSDGCDKCGGRLRVCNNYLCRLKYKTPDSYVIYIGYGIYERTFLTNKIRTMFNVDM